MKKFGHVLRDEYGWHMFYSNFVQPHCPNSITRYAFSEMVYTGRQEYEG